MKYLKNELKMFAESVKNLDKKILRIFSIDLLYVVSILFTGQVLKLIIESFADSVNKKMQLDLLTQDLATLPLEFQNELANLFNIFALKTLLVIAVFLVIAFVLYCFSRSLIWTFIFKKKFTNKYFKGFCLISLIWLLFIILISIILGLFLNSIMYPISPPLILLLTFIILFFIIHSVTLLQVVYTQKNKVGLAYKKLWILGVKKIRFFLIPYLLVLFVWVVFNFLDVMLKRLMGSGVLFIIITFLASLFLVAWFRFYISTTIKRVENIK